MSRWEAISVRDGEWHDKTTWDGKRVPDRYCVVRNRHLIDVTRSARADEIRSEGGTVHAFRKPPRHWWWRLLQRFGCQKTLRANLVKGGSTFGVVGVHLHRGVLKASTIEAGDNWCCTRPTGGTAAFKYELLNHPNGHIEFLSGPTPL